MAEHMSEGALRIDGHRRPVCYAAGLMAQNRARILRHVGLEKRGSAFRDSPPGRHEISE
jgi:hypothetical protein